MLKQQFKINQENELKIISAKELLDQDKRPKLWGIPYKQITEKDLDNIQLKAATVLSPINTVAATTEGHKELKGAWHRPELGLDSK